MKILTLRQFEMHPSATIRFIVSD